MIIRRYTLLVLFEKIYMQYKDFLSEVWDSHYPPRTVELRKTLRRVSKYPLGNSDFNIKIADCWRLLDALLIEEGLEENHVCQAYEEVLEQSHSFYMAVRDFSALMYFYKVSFKSYGFSHPLMQIFEDIYAPAPDQEVMEINAFHAWVLLREIRWNLEESFGIEGVNYHQLSLAMKFLRDMLSAHL